MFWVKQIVLSLVSGASSTTPTKKRIVNTIVKHDGELTKDQLVSALQADGIEVDHNLLARKLTFLVEHKVLAAVGNEQGVGTYSIDGGLKKLGTIKKQMSILA